MTAVFASNSEKVPVTRPSDDLGQVGGETSCNFEGCAKRIRTLEEQVHELKLYSDPTTYDRLSSTKEECFTLKKNLRNTSEQLKLSTEESAKYKGDIVLLKNWNDERNAAVRLLANKIALNVVEKENIREREKQLELLLAQRKLDVSRTQRIFCEYEINKLNLFRKKVTLEGSLRSVRQKIHKSESKASKAEEAVNQQAELIRNYESKLTEYDDKFEALQEELEESRAIVLRAAEAESKAREAQKPASHDEILDKAGTEFSSYQSTISDQTLDSKRLHEIRHQVTNDIQFLNEKMQLLLEVKEGLDKRLNPADTSKNLTEKTVPQSLTKANVSVSNESGISEKEDSSIPEKLTQVSEGSSKRKKNRRDVSASENLAAKETERTPPSSKQHKSDTPSKEATSVKFASNGSGAVEKVPIEKTPSKAKTTDSPSSRSGRKRKTPVPRSASKLRRSTRKRNLSPEPQKPQPAPNPPKTGRLAPAAEKLFAFGHAASGAAMKKK